MAFRILFSTALFFFLGYSIIYAQSGEHNDEQVIRSKEGSIKYSKEYFAKQSELSFNILISDANIKERLFGSEKLLEGHELFPGFEISFNKKLYKNLRIETGIEYFYSSFITDTRISEGILFDANGSRQIDYNIVDDNPIGEYHSQVSFEWGVIPCNVPFLEDQELTVSHKNKINMHTLGVPIKLEYVFGTEPLQAYFSIGVTPSFYLKRNLDHSFRNVGPSVSPIHCNSENLSVVIESSNYQDVENETQIIEENLNDFFISTLLSAGIKHMSKRNVFKLGLVYGGSNINFSDADRSIAVKQIFALRMGIGIRL